MAVVDYTTDFTNKVDTNSRLTVAATKIDYAALQNDDEVWHADDGTNITSPGTSLFTHEWESVFTSTSSAFARAFHWAVATIAGDRQDFTGAGNDSISVMMGTGSSSTTRVFYIVEYNGTASNFSANLTSVSLATVYYMRMERTSSTNVRLSQFTNSSRTTHATGSPINLTITNNTYSFSYGLHSRDASSGTANSTGYVQNHDFDAGGAASTKTRGVIGAGVGSGII